MKKERIKRAKPSQRVQLQLKELAYLKSLVGDRVKTIDPENGDEEDKMANNIRWKIMYAIDALYEKTSNKHNYMAEPNNVHNNNTHQ